ncbi:MAG: hypothetical protein ABEH90_09760 [Halolamina sp.]
MSEHRAGLSRRGLLRTGAGAVSVGVAGLAGCTGGGGSSSIAIASAPTPTTKLQANYLREQTNVFEEVYDELGYDAELQLTWDELSLFMGGEADLAPSVGSVEAAKLAVEQDQQLRAHAVTAPQHTGLYVRKGSEYDPAEAGSVQAAVDALAESGTMGIGGWGLGTIPAYRLIFKERFGYDFSENGDFEVVTAEFPTLASLVANGDIDAGGSGPPYNLWDVRDDLTPLFWNQNQIAEMGFPRRSVAIGNGVSRADYAEQNGEAVAAYFGMLRRANEYLRDNIDEVAGQASTQETLGADSKEQAKWVLEFRLRADHSPNTVPASPVQNGLSQEYIKQDKQALGKAAEMGAVPENWADGFGYQSLDIQKYYEMAKSHE